MSARDKVQYISDFDGRQTGVIVPIKLWREIASERETAYLLASPENRKRLLAAKKGSGQRVTLQEVRAKLGI